MSLKDVKPRNVIVILLDSLNRHMLGAYGGGKFDMRHFPIAACLLVPSLLLGAIPALAEEGLVLEPGQWKFDIAVRAPMQSEPSRQSVQSCLDGAPVGPSTLMPWADEQGCKLKGIEVEENKLTWKIICNMNGQIARGKGEFESTGDNAKGKSKVSFETGGQRLSIKTEWAGERLGACNPEESGALESPAEPRIGDQESGEQEPEQ
jgi:hypothetical protein